MTAVALVVTSPPIEAGLSFKKRVALGVGLLS